MWHGSNGGSPLPKLIVPPIRRRHTWLKSGFVLTALGLAIFITAGLAQAALPNQNADDTAMVDGAGARVRAITETAGGRIWVAGDFQEVDNSTGAIIRSVNNLVAFTPSGALDTGVTIPDVTQAGGGAIVYDMSLSPSGILYLAGNFDHVGNAARNNVAAIDPNTGNVLPFSPNVAQANAVYATSTAIYVGTGKLLSYQPNGVKTPGFSEAQMFIDAGIRAHVTIPQVRDITSVGSTLVVACQCDSITDGNGTRNVKAVVEVNATTGNLLSWTPSGLNTGSAAFGISVIVRNSTVYLGAGGSDFTASYDFTSGAQDWKTDTSGSSQVVAWYQNELIVGGHYDWTEHGNSGTCGDNATPNTACYHTPKLSSMDPATGTINLVSGVPWNPGVCCKYNGIWVLTPDSDGSTLHVGGEFTKFGGTWSGSGTNWTLNGGATQQYYARLSGPNATTQPLSVAKAVSGGATGTVTSSPSGINCNTSCQSASADFATNTNVTLTATPTSGFTFTGWSGDCTNTTGTCQVTMSTARSVTATFAPISFALTVSKTGAGTGTVTSSPAGVDCGSTCSPFFAQNTVVTLTGTPGPNSAFNGWTGSGCSGTGTCVVTMSAAKSVTADFASTSKNITVINTKGATGLGAGVISSTNPSISCGTGLTCGPFATSSGTVTLTAAANSGSIFNGWSGGGCSGTATTCVVTMDVNQTVTGDFEKARNVTVTMAGTGAGTVTSVPAGVDCPTTCSKTYPQGSTVTLTATPDANSFFSGWSGTASGPGCTGTAPCVLTMDGGKQLTATFVPAKTLTVTPAGTGGGTVTSSPAGIDCGLTCTANYVSGNVTLSATPDANSSFIGWSGEGCTGTGTCVVSMTQARNVTATFTLLQRQLTVSMTGQGTVSDNPGPINCTTGNTGTCSASYEHGTDVLLTATPAVNFEFTGWSGDCTGTDICVVSMTQARTVTAQFGQISRTVTVARDGNGTGTVTSTPGGITCGIDCAAPFGQGASVTLNQVADPGSVFTGWSGDCSGTGACVLAIDGAKNVTATFQPVYTLTVDPVTGTGSVTSDVGGIDCPDAACSASDLVQGSHVILTATPGVGSVFSGWSGGGCSGTALTCDVTMSGDQTVSATFGPATILDVATNGGAGTGTVTSSPAGIDCGATCSHAFAGGASVTLHATADAGNAFTGWNSGDAGFSCPGTSDCIVTMNIARSVTASFEPTVLLTVQRLGSGGGAVTSTPAGINCGATCSAGYLLNTSVTLHAADGPNSAFTGWSGDVGATCPGITDCTVTMDVARTVQAHFDPIMHQLTVTKDGSGTGTVTSLAPNPGIDCGTTCAYDFQQGTSVTLHAAADGTSTFTGWSGGGCSGTADCTVTIDVAKSVNATFDLAQRTLTVTKAGNGNGTVTSDVGGINCPGTCSANYAHGSAVVLTANLGANSTFTGWSGGACSGTATTCNVTMDAAKSVTATFTLNKHTLSVSKLGTGSGSVTSAPTGIDCGATCSANFDHGTLVTLTPTPDANNVFTGWGGACTGTGSCQVTMNAAASVSASFAPTPRQLTVTKAGAGTGTVSSSPAGINACATTCSANFDHGTIVGLTPTATGGSTFANWSGACTGSGACSVTMDAAKSVTATFNPPVTTVTFQDTDPAVAYNGWKGVTDAAADGGAYRMSKVTNDKITWKSVVTTSLTWIARTGPNMGKASVTIDGTNKGTVDLYSAAAGSRSSLYGGLASKAHTVVIKVLGTKTAPSTDTNVSLDYFLVGTTKTQESDVKVKYNSWTGVSDANASGGTYRWATAANSTATVTFTGTSIDWITTRGKAYGKATVSIDGGPATTIDLYQSATAWQSVINFGGLTPGQHTIVVKVLNQKNASATGTKVIVDAFIAHA